MACSSLVLKGEVGIPHLRTYCYFFLLTLPFLIFFRISISHPLSSLSKNLPPLLIFFISSFKGYILWVVSLFCCAFCLVLLLQPIRLLLFHYHFAIHVPQLWLICLYYFLFFYCLRCSASIGLSSVPRLVISVQHLFVLCCSAWILLSSSPMHCNLSSMGNQLQLASAFCLDVRLSRGASDKTQRILTTTSSPFVSAMPSNSRHYHRPMFKASS